MTVRRVASRGTPGSETEPREPLLSVRALVLLLVAVACGVLAVVSPAWAIGIGMAAAVLTLLDRLVR